MKMERERDRSIESDRNVHIEKIFPLKNRKIEM